MKPAPAVPPGFPQLRTLDPGGVLRPGRPCNGERFRQSLLARYQRTFGPKLRRDVGKSSDACSHRSQARCAGCVLSNLSPSQPFAYSVLSLATAPKRCQKRRNSEKIALVPIEGFAGQNRAGNPHLIQSQRSPRIASCQQGRQRRHTGRRWSHARRFA